MKNSKLELSFINMPHLREIKNINYPRNRLIGAGYDGDIRLLILNNHSLGFLQKVNVPLWL